MLPALAALQNYAGRRLMTGLDEPLRCDSVEVPTNWQGPAQGQQLCSCTWLKSQGFPAVFWAIVVHWLCVTSGFFHARVFLEL